MSLRAIVKRFLLAGRQIAETRVCAWRNHARSIAKTKDAKTSQESCRQITVSTTNYLHYFLRGIFTSRASEIRRRVAADLMYRGSPLFAFVGITLANVPKTDEQGDLCQNIRELFNKNKASDDSDHLSTAANHFKDFRLGNVIAKGCNAVVHEARLAGKFQRLSQLYKESLGLQVASVLMKDELGNDEEADGFVFLPSKNEEEENAARENVGNSYRYAVKMMFNYDAESNTDAILQAMGQEVVPARSPPEGSFGNIPQWQTRCCKTLPPHANIVEMWNVFVDKVPLLTGALQLYPDALPASFYPNGFGRNMTLFLIMKRYTMTLREYLGQVQASMQVRMQLFAQLLEGVVHMTEHDIAHRDLKTDNILLQVDNYDMAEDDCPQLVISDFGCCLADAKLGMKLPYESSYVYKGGNTALMAPEISCEQSHRGCVLDYSKADLWAAGAVAYEIFGGENPFYRPRNDNGNRRLDSRTYRAEEVPGLPVQVPSQIASLVLLILSRDPSQRPSAVTCANVLHMLLWGLPDFIPQPTLYLSTFSQWLQQLAAVSLLQQSDRCSRSKRDVSQQLRRTFLRRVDADNMRQAVLLLLLLL